MVANTDLVRVLIGFVFRPIVAEGCGRCGRRCSGVRSSSVRCTRRSWRGGPVGSGTGPAHARCGGGGRRAGACSRPPRPASGPSSHTTGQPASRSRPVRPPVPRQSPKYTTGADPDADAPTQTGQAVAIGYGRRGPPRPSRPPHRCRRLRPVSPPSAVAATRGRQHRTWLTRPSARASSSAHPRGARSRPSKSSSPPTPPSRWRSTRRAVPRRRRPG